MSLWEENVLVAKNMCNVIKRILGQGIRLAPRKTQTAAQQTTITNRQANMKPQTDKTVKEADKHTDRQTEGQADKHAYTDRQDSEASRQTCRYRQTDNEGSRQISTQTESKVNKDTNRQKQKDKQVVRQPDK